MPLVCHGEQANAKISHFTDTDVKKLSFSVIVNICQNFIKFEKNEPCK